jgi:hypothetical protein
MTLGAAKRDIRALEDRLTMIETGEGWKGDERRNGATFSDKQVEWILKNITEVASRISKAGSDQAFNRLIFWAAISAFAGGAAVMGAYLRLHG